MKGKTMKSVTPEEEDVELPRAPSKKSFFQKELKELTAGEIVVVVAATMVTIVGIITIRDIVRDILDAMVGMCFFVVLAIVLIVAAIGGSRK